MLCVRILFIEHFQIILNVKTSLILKGKSKPIDDSNTGDPQKFDPVENLNQLAFLYFMLMTE